MAQFVHLHLHTQYSILDGAASTKSIIKRAKEYGMGAVAITDHGNMYGVKEFHTAARKEGIKPILGCEVYVVRNRFEKDKDEKAGDHLILLAKNLTGYHNLIKIVSYSFTEGFYYKPRIDKSLLREYHEGIICSSACIGGELPQAILHGNMAEADAIVEEFKSIFGEDYYLEMQLHRTTRPDIPVDELSPKQERVNQAIMELAARHNVKYIASNDVHFTDADDWQAHDHLICLNTGRDLDDPKRMRYSGQEFFKSADQMAALFPDHPEAIETTLEIADKVEEYSLEHAPLMPNFPIPEEFVIDRDKLDTVARRNIKDEELKAQIEACSDIEELATRNPKVAEKLTTSRQYLYLEHLVNEGIIFRYGKNPDERVRERVAYELRTIEWMGFPGYFLIVWDFIRAARAMGVSVGPGRGSAAGSVVAYALKITNIDPLKYDLLFERFLNPDRISLPDVDVDFDDDGRSQVLNYVVEKYGRKRVAQIVTFGCMAPKLAIKDVARVEKLPLSESDRLTKLVPDKLDNDKMPPFEWLYKTVPDLARERDSGDQLVRSTLAFAEKLEGSVRQTGVHACGVIIGQDDLEKFAPIATAKDADLNVVQFEGKLVESVGLIKMDFLGLKNLSIIKAAIDNIRRVRGVEIDIDAIPLDDQLTYELYSRGETNGIFQFESDGMKKYLRALKPNRLEDIIAMNALYRPGPMDKIPNFIDRKNGREAVTYEFPEMEEYLKDTYGITVYQEQVMLLSQALAGFTGGEADTLRKAMGKKQREVLDKLKPKFLAGAAERNHDTALCEKIWGEWEAFARYAFNKSHATCYAYVSYQTAYLKAHYPSEYMAALLSRSLSNMDKISFFMDECKRMGIKVLGPDVNESMLQFAADATGNIRFGLAAIKGVGENAVNSIIEERDRGGKFQSIYDLVERINLSSVNRKTLENMIIAGALDSISGAPRSRFFNGELPENGNGNLFLDQLVRYGQQIQNERNAPQQNLFGMSQSAEVARPQMSVTTDWPMLEILNREKEVIGMYLSSHPLDQHAMVMRSFCTTPLTALADITALAGKSFTVGGMVVVAKQDLYTRNNKPYGRFTVEDYSGSHEFVLFDRDYENFRKYLYVGYFLSIECSVVPRRFKENELEVRINSIITLDELRSSIRCLTVQVPIEAVDDELIDTLSKYLTKPRKHADTESVELKLRIGEVTSQTTVRLRSMQRVELSSELTATLERNEISYSLSR